MYSSILLYQVYTRAITKNSTPAPFEVNRYSLESSQNTPHEASLLFLPFFSISIWKSFVSSCLFLVDTMLSPRFSVSAATRLAYYMYRLTYVHWSHIFIFVWGIRFVSVIVCIFFCFLICFTAVIFRSRFSCWSLPCDHGLHCSDELMWEQQQRCWLANSLSYPFISPFLRDNDPQVHLPIESKYAPGAIMLWYWLVKSTSYPFISTFLTDNDPQVHFCRRLIIYPGSVWRAHVRVGSGCQSPGTGCSAEFRGGKRVCFYLVSVCLFYVLYTSSSTSVVT